MNKKGFTLTELLATIAIIAIVSLIGTVSITGIKAKIEANMFESKLELAMGAAKSWGQDNKESIMTSTCGTTQQCINVTLEELMNAKYLEADEIDKTSSEVVLYDNFKKNIKDTIVNVFLKNGWVYSCIDETNILSEDESAIAKYSDFLCS